MGDARSRNRRLIPSGRPIPPHLRGLARKETGRHAQNDAAVQLVYFYLVKVPVAAFLARTMLAADFLDTLIATKGQPIADRAWQLTAVWGRGIWRKVCEAQARPGFWPPREPPDWKLHLWREALFFAAERSDAMDSLFGLVNHLPNLVPEDSPHAPTSHQ